MLVSERKVSVVGVSLGLVVAMVVRWLWQKQQQQKNGKWIRVVQYNVKRLAELETVAETLEKLKPTVVTLNEVDVGAVPEGLKKLAARLELPSIHFYGHARGGTYGNAVLCKSGRSVLEKKLAGGTTVKLPTGADHVIVRGCVVVETEGVEVVATHLDHVSEDQRATQARDLVDTLKPFPNALLAADLNALRRADYTDDTWKVLELRNSNNDWPPPPDSSKPGGALAVLEDAGYRDLGLLAATRDRVTPAGTANSHCPGGDVCQRIDYVHAAPALFPRLRRVHVFSDLTATGSDHIPLVVDLLLS